MTTLAEIQAYLNLEIPNRPAATGGPFTALNYLRALGTGKFVEQRTPSQVLADISAAASGHNHDGTYLKDIVEDLSPQLGGDLDTNNKEIFNSGTGTVPIKLGDNAGAQTLSVFDSDSVIQFAVDSNGNLGLAGLVDGRDVDADGTAQDSHIAASNPHSGSLSNADEAVTNAKLAHMAQSTIKGRAAAAGTGDATDLSVAQILTVLGLTNALKIAMVFYIENPLAGKEYPVQMAPASFTIDKIKHMTDVGTVDFNIEERVTPDVAGVNVFASDEQATSTYQTETSFSNDSIDAEDPIAIDISAVASSPTKLWVYILGTINA